MIVTSRAAKFLQSLPDDDATALIDAVATVAADPDTHGPRCKKLGAGLREARVTLHHQRAYRCMFGFRSGMPILLTACLKKSQTDHQREIDRARQTLTIDVPREGVAMPKEHHHFSVTSWLYDSRGRQLRIVHHTRKKVTVATEYGLVELRRSRLERDGFDTVDGVTYSLTRYQLPHEMEISL